MVQMQGEMVQGEGEMVRKQGEMGQTERNRAKDQSFMKKESNKST